jgi:hypothetical protein
LEARGQERVYGLRPKPLRQLHGWLERYRRLWDDRFADMDQLLEELKRGK